MTNDEAIQIISAYKSKLTDSCSNQLDQDITAFNMAIAAMERSRSGTWQIKGSGTTNYHTCSVCGCDGDIWDDFCRHCGADMR